MTFENRGMQIVFYLFLQENICLLVFGEVSSQTPWTSTARNVVFMENEKKHF